MFDRVAARSFYDRFGARQDTQAFYEDPAVHHLIDHAGFDGARSVFEFGCGTGRFAERLLAQHLPATATYAGCDLSTTMVQLATERLTRFQERATVQLSDGSPRVDRPESSFDRFVSNYVLDLLPPQDITAVLAEARRVLSADGRICLVGLTHGKSALSRLVSGVWAQVHRLRPSLVGGCRPLDLREFVSESDWQIYHRAVVVAFGVPSEVLVARKRA